MLELQRQRMTRINTIDPSHLADQHLIAEHREYGIAIYSFVNSLNSKNGIVPSKISPEYTLNKGHVYFFYDKMMYIKHRHQELKAEAVKRGFNLNLVLDWSEVPDEYMNDWSPNANSHAVNVERILQRLNQRPDWYRYYGKPLNQLFYDNYKMYVG